MRYLRIYCETAPGDGSIDIQYKVILAYSQLLLNNERELNYVREYKCNRQCLLKQNLLLLTFSAVEQIF
jgi:hypothetical protein